MGKSKKQKYSSPQFMNNMNKNYSSPERIYRWSDRSKCGYVRKPGYNSYSRYRPYYRSNETHFNKNVARKPPSRPSSPVLGSEEYMVKKVQQTSAIIMKHLLNPEECLPEHSQKSKDSNENKKDCSEMVDKKSNKTKDKSTEVNENKNKNLVTYNIEEIQMKIMNHITNLNDGKKKNLVFSGTSNYDIAIQQIQKQKRLEISRALRNMCSQSETQESSAFINSIIPDIGIKIEDLPHDLIEELSNTLNLDYGMDNQRNNYEEDFPNSFSQDTGYGSLGEIQSSEMTETKYFGDRSNTEEFVNDKVVQNTENFEITVKKEIEEFPENSVYTEEATDITDSLPVKNSNEIDENIEYITFKIKQEDKDPEFNDSNEALCDKTNTNLGLNSSEPTASLVRGLQLETNILPINEESHNDTIKNRVTEKISPYTLDMSTQTDETCICSKQSFIEHFLEANSFGQPPKSVSDAITRMLKIDECILELTKYRQTLFNKFKKTDDVCSAKEESGSNLVKTAKKKKRKKKKASNQKDIPDIPIVKKVKTDEIKNVNQENTSESIPNSVNHNKSNCDVAGYRQIESSCGSTSKIEKQSLLHLEEFNEKILFIKAVEDKLVAGSEHGNIFMCSLENGHCTNTLHASDVPITALWFERYTQQNIDMYVGSFENRLKVYDFRKQVLVKTVGIDDSIQCLESSWGYIFMGCMRGSLIRYSIKKAAVEYEDKWADDRILVIKATQEGARRILLVGSRNSPVCIKDAMTGLYMRTMDNIFSPTVYSLIMEKSLIYCGTTNHNILVYSFHDGKLSNTFKAASSKGISCLKIIKNLLFASCHNGNIYVYDVKGSKFIDSIEGPGGIILSMEVLENQVIVGTMSFKFTSLPIPQHILKCNDL